MRGLYVHVPFCIKKCHYCDFYSIPAADELLDVYIDAVLSEADKYRGLEFESLYIGGGTPSILGKRRLEKLVEGLYTRLDMHKSREASIEVNPESASKELLESTVALGINRVSIGVQSLNDDELIKAGRIHNAVQALEAIQNTKDCGITNISADVIIGLPGQTQDSLLRTFDVLCGKELTHISAYCLSVEKHTRFSQSPPCDLPDDDMQAELFSVAVNMLKRRGYVHYEISNFSLPGYQCSHNLNYWRGGEYIGLGPSAVSHLNGIRVKNSANLDEYLRDPLKIDIEVDVLDPENKMSEEAMLRLRLLEEGLDLPGLLKRHNVLKHVALKDRLDRLVACRLLTEAGNIYKLPPEGVLTSNQVFVDVIN